MVEGKEGKIIRILTSALKRSRSDLSRDAVHGAERVSDEGYQRSTSKRPSYAVCNLVGLLTVAGDSSGVI